MYFVKFVQVMYLILFVSTLFAQNVPEYMYFKFDAAGNQTNYASSPVGTNPAVLNGLTIGSTGEFGTALIGNGLTSSSNRLNTGWATNLPSTGWTISFWLKNFPSTSSTTYYYFGDASAGSFRCFTGGVAGNGNLIVRGTGLTDVFITGIPSTPTVIHLVYTGSSVKVYKNGSLSNTVSEPALTISGAGPFLVGGFSYSNSINAGTLMDEFRMYNRALSDDEIALTWNQTLPIPTGIQGTVTQNINGGPVSNAIVTVDGYPPVLTDATGFYKVFDMTPGTVTINVVATGCTAYTGTATIVAYQTTVKNIQMTTIPTYLTGNVTKSGTSDPVSGAKVTVGSTFTYTLTDGSYYFQVFPPGSQTVTIEKSGYLNNTASINITEGGTTTHNALLEEITLSSLLLAYYPFISNANDESGNFNNGTANGATLTNDRFENPDAAYSFASGAHIKVPQVSWSAIGTGDFTIVAWIYPQVLTGDLRMILCDDKLNNFQFNINSFGSQLELYLGQSGTAYSGNFIFGISKWYFIAVTRQSGSVRFYINGLSSGSSTTLNSNISASSYIDIGYRTSNGAHPFNGKLDDIRIYNRCLNAGTIHFLYADQFIWSGISSSDWNTSSNWTSSLIPSQHNVPGEFNDVRIPNTTVKPQISSGNNYKCFDLIIENGANLTIEPNASLIVKLYTILNGSEGIKILSSSLGSGSFITYGDFVGTGTIRVERYITGNWAGGVPSGSTIFHSVSTPVSNGTAVAFSGSLLRSYNESTQSWVEITDPLTVLDPKKGYFVATPSNGVKTFTGIPGSGDLVIDGLSNTGGGNPAYNGFNLIGNPYPSPVQYASNWPKTNLTGTIYIWDQTFTGNYRFHDGITGNLPGGIIPMGQGFFVKVNTIGTGSITIPYSLRVHSTNAFMKQDVANLLDLKVTGNNYADETMIFFIPDAVSGFDLKYDGYKMRGLEDAPQLYSIFDGIGNLCIKALPDMKTYNPVHLGLQVGSTGVYTINASGIESFVTGTSFYLEDISAKKTVKLNDNPIYSFTANPGDAEHRFNLHFNSVGLQGNSSNSARIEIYSFEKDVYVNAPEKMSGRIFIYNMLGVEQTSMEIKENSINKITLNVPTGYYIIKILSNKDIVTQKVFIH